MVKKIFVKISDILDILNKKFGGILKAIADSDVQIQRGTDTFIHSRGIKIISYFLNIHILVLKREFVIIF